MGQSCCATPYKKSYVDFPEELLDIIKQLQASNQVKQHQYYNGVKVSGKFSKQKLLEDGYGEVTFEHMQYFGHFQGKKFHGKGLLVSKTPKQHLIQKQKSLAIQNSQPIKQTQGNEQLLQQLDTNDNYILQYYYGQFKNGKCDGQGEQKRFDLKFIGKYAEGQRIQGKLKCQLFEYHGEFKNNKFHGKGKIKYNNGSIYEGQFQNGHIHGKGQFRVTDDQKYFGSFQNNMLHGYGTYQWKNHEATYQGQYFQGKKHGFGKLQVRQFIYEGKWMMGKMNGSGRTICEHKMAFGQWKAGKLCV